MEFIKDLTTIHKMQKVILNQVALVGHTYNEYKQMFGLDRSQLKNRTILDAGAGVSNFCGIANAFDLKVTAVDAIYDLPLLELEQRCKRDLMHVLNQLPKIQNLYNWDYFGDLAGLEISRIKAFQLFLKDYESNPNHYVPGSITNLPFEDLSFDVSLVSHLLFLYDELYDESFHEKALEELMRVTKEEIIVYPLYNLNGDNSNLLEFVCDKLSAMNLNFVLEESEYPVFKEKNKRLRIKLPQL